MIYVDAADQTLFEGQTAAEVVRSMRDAAWLASESKLPYMREVAHRCRELNQTVLVDPTSATAFLRTLVTAGFLLKASEGR